VKIGDIVKMKGPDGEVGLVVELDNQTGFTRVVWQDGVSLCATSHLILIEYIAHKPKTESSIFS